MEHVEMNRAFMLTDEGLAAWLYGFLGAFDPVDNEAIQDDGSAKIQYDAAVAMLRRLAALDEVEGWDDHPLPRNRTHLAWAVRRAVSYGGRHAEASARALKEGGES